MTSYLNEVFKSVQKVNKNLADRIVYTAKAYKKDSASVMKKDLYDLCKEAMDCLVTPATPVVAEASVKPVAKKKVKKAEPKAEETPEETVEEPKEETPKATKKAGKKAVTKKSAKKADPIVTAVEPVTKSKKEVILAQRFKEKIVSETLGTLEIAHDIQTLDDLKKAVDNEELLVFAMYWTARDIKQFAYGANIDLKYVPKQFVDDLDLASLVYIGEVNDIAWAVSNDTDAMYSFNSEDLAEDDGLRFTNGGVEYQIYRQTEEPTPTEEDDEE